jgi:hypothetical protein
MTALHLTLPDKTAYLPSADPDLTYGYLTRLVQVPWRVRIDGHAEIEVANAHVCRRQDGHAGLVVAVAGLRSTDDGRLLAGKDVILRYKVGGPEVGKLDIRDLGGRVHTKSIAKA